MNDTDTKLATSATTTLGQDITALLRHWLRGRRALIALAIASAAIGAWFGWPSLVAAGIAPLLLAVLPCLAMCALGLCVMKGGGRSCDAGSAKDAAADAPAEDAPADKVQRAEREE